MNRLQKKCIIVSGGIHLLLAVMLIFGPGFLSSDSDNAPPLLKFVPGATVEAIMSGGGDNSVKSPPAEATSPEPPTPQPVVVPPVVTPPVQVTPPPVERAQPRPPEKELPVPKDPPRVNTPTIDPTPIKPAPRKPHEINVDTTLVTSSAADAKAKRDAQQKAAAAAAAKERQHLANIAAAFGQATKGIRNGVAGGVKVNVSPGPGGGGVSYGNIQSAIFTRYYEAWKVPDGSPDLKVYVSITLARDGAVVTSRITKRSGNADLDESVQKALDRVRFVAPLPEGETADTREFEFNFKPEMKSAE